MLKVHRAVISIERKSYRYVHPTAQPGTNNFRILDATTEEDCVCEENPRILSYLTLFRQAGKGTGGERIGGRLIHGNESCQIP